MYAFSHTLVPKIAVEFATVPSLVTPMCLPGVRGAVILAVVPHLGTASPQLFTTYSLSTILAASSMFPSDKPGEGSISTYRVAPTKLPAVSGREVSATILLAVIA